MSQQGRAGSLHDVRDVVGRRRWWPMVSVCVGALGAGLAVVRSVPDQTVDAGVFASVAERLIAGDTLYSEVWDNKDPFFYYLWMISRLASPLGPVFVELIWLAIVAVAVASLARGFGVARASIPFLVGAALVITTGSSYVAGLTHLPGTALCLVALAVAHRQRPIAAGVVLGLLTGIKLIMAPIGVLLVALILFKGPHAAIRRVVAAWLGTGLALVVAVAVRGELGPYVASLMANVGYSQGTLVSSGTLPGALQHLRLVFDTGAALAAPAMALTALAFLASAPLTPTSRRLWWAASASFGSGFAVIALTGMRDHHAQVLVPAYLLVLLVGVAQWASPHPRPGNAVAILGAAFLLAGSVYPGTYVTELRAMPARLAAFRAVSPQAADLARLTTTPGSYARLGQSDLKGHAAGLAAWRLACPRFHQYPFDAAADLERVLSCAQGVDVIIVESNIEPSPGSPSAWAPFSVGAQAMLEKGFDCRTMSSGVVCLARSRAGFAFPADTRPPPHWLTDRRAIAP